MRPNFIPGMKMRGIGRRSKQPHFNKLKRSWIEFTAYVRKDKLEQKRRELANRPFEE